MTETEDKKTLDEIYETLDYFANGYDDRKPRDILDSLWELIKTWYYSRHYYEYKDFYPEDDET